MPLLLSEPPKPILEKRHGALDPSTNTKVNLRTSELTTLSPKLKLWERLRRTHTEPTVMITGPIDYDSPTNYSNAILAFEME